jgi:hypothetical protein
MDQPLASRADIEILFGYVAKILLAIAPPGSSPGQALRLDARRERFGQGDGNTGLFTRQYLVAFEVAPVGNNIEGNYSTHPINSPTTPYRHHI